MDFLEKLDFMMKRYNLNKRSLSIKSDIPYTTIDNWYKRGYEGIKLETLRKLSNYFNTLIDFWVLDDVTDPNHGKVNSFSLELEETQHIIKYRSLDPYGKEAVDGVLDVEYRRCEVAKTSVQAGPTEEKETVFFYLPYFLQPSSAGTGQTVGEDPPEEKQLKKEPPKGASYITRVSGDSMEPTYHDGDLLFVSGIPEIRRGQIGIFFMDGQQWVKELGNGILISHNPQYAPRPFTEDVRCQGLVLGVCDESYFE